MPEPLDVFGHDLGDECATVGGAGGIVFAVCWEGDFEDGAQGFEGWVVGGQEVVGVEEALEAGALHALEESFGDAVQDGVEARDVFGGGDTSGFDVVGGADEGEFGLVGDRWIEVWLSRW